MAVYGGAVVVVFAMVRTWWVWQCAVEEAELGASRGLGAGKELGEGVVGSSRGGSHRPWSMHCASEPSSELRFQAYSPRCLVCLP